VRVGRVDDDLRRDRLPLALGVVEDAIEILGGVRLLDEADGRRSRRGRVTGLGQPLEREVERLVRTKRHSPEDDGPLHTMPC
jgi:hypothetical protein